MANSKEIKQQFLKFFEGKGHKIVPSAPIVVKNDPTLMFTNAGMNQFKDYFLGNAEATSTRVVDTQKCLRVSGKHNDLEEVGHDHYHHTMFEMLGNWSFGDYFKEEAIAWAWELLTEVYKLPKDQLYVTVFEGDESEKLQFDLESFNIWKKYIAEDRILKGNKKDNFWEMGDTGPCGPCTEIHFDGRSENDRLLNDGAKLVNADHPDVIEIWNNVFMEFNRKADGSLEKLPSRHVDTGMGFERLVRVIERKNSNYDTDVFQYIIQATGKICSKSYGTHEKQDVAFRVIADHIRAVALCIADGQLPSNTGAGYVIRRILRRAVRYGYSYLGIQDPFLHSLVADVAEYFNDVFPELEKQKDFVAKVIKEEEASFFRTLSQGIQILDGIFIAGGDKTLSGKRAFELYDTFGFPIDLTELICRENGWKVDKAEFDAELQIQKSRSRADSAKETGDWIYLLNQGEIEEDFVGYDFLETVCRISRYRTVKQKGKEQFQIVLDSTPFYAESGGQVGDLGELIGRENNEIIQVLDTQKENKLHIHICDKLPINLEQNFHAKIDSLRRLDISKNHSATHIMHSALRDILGNHVAQKGSLVNDHHLRFDFSHFSKITDEELQKIENQVNEKIKIGIPLTEHRNMPVQQAIDMGATALFGEKYGDHVRVIVFDEKYSMELCGGTHVSNTGFIGMFKIVAESSVAAGVRRIEAITSTQVLQKLLLLESQERELAAMLNNSKDVIKSVSKLVMDYEEMKQKFEAFELEKLLAIKKELSDQVIQRGALNCVIAKVKLFNPENAKSLCFQLKEQFDNFIGILAFEADSKPGIAIILSENLVTEKGLDAAALVRELGKEIQGGGGGQKFFATAGGKELAGLDRVVSKANDWLKTL